MVIWREQVQELETDDAQKAKKTESTNTTKEEAVDEEVEQE